MYSLALMVLKLIIHYSCFDILFALLFNIFITIELITCGLPLNEINIIIIRSFLYGHKRGDNILSKQALASSQLILSYYFFQQRK